MRASWRGHWPLALILFAFVTLATFYNVANPIFEAPDELWHFRMVRHLAGGGGLPVLQHDPEQNVAGQEGGQPPLYYAIAALATSWIDMGDIESLSVPSAYLQGIGGGSNVVVHTAREDFPYQRTTLAVHAVRFFSTLLGAGTVLLTYLLALEVLRGKKHLALGTAALTAFIPQFLFLSASVSNDNLIILASALALFLSVRAVNKGLSLRGTLLLGAVLAAGPLSKLSGMALPALAVFCLGIRAWRERSVGPVRSALLVAGIAVAGSGWWFLRNWTLYGDPLGLNMFLIAVGDQPTVLTAELVWTETRRIWLSMWALFGWSNVEADFGLYAMYGAVCVISLMGLAALVKARRFRHYAMVGSNALVLSLWIAAFVFLVFRYMTLAEGMQGRLLFPALPAIAVFIMVGLAGAVPRAWSRQLAGALGLLLFIPALLAPFLYILPAYARVGLLDDTQLSAIPHRLDVRFGETVKLLGYKMDAPHVRSGQPLEITLYWQATAPPVRDYTVFVHAFDAWGNAVGEHDRVIEPRYPTAAWRTGDALKETYNIPLQEPQGRPSSVRIEVGLYAYPSAERLPAFDAQGRGLGTSVQVAKAKAVGPLALAPANAKEEKIGDGLALVAYQGPDRAMSPGEMLEGRIWWRALASQRQDYTVFVQLIGGNGLLSQYDAQPRAGSYPTSLWDKDEVVEDFFRMAIPRNAAPGVYRLIAGMYDTGTGERLSAGGTDHVVLAVLTLEPGRPPQ